MKKVFYLIGISTLFLFASCENEAITESITDTKMFAPTVKGAIGNFADANPTTKAGVVEDNEDFRDVGEFFYWHSGDEALLIFVDNNDPGAAPFTLTYSTNFEDTDKLKNRPFTTDEAVPEGEYTVYGLYPAAAWTLVGEVYTATLDNPGALTNLESSEYLGRNMLMKAKAENVTIGEEESNEIELSYQHLGGVIRFHVRNNNNPEHPVMTQLQMAKTIGGTPQPFFPVSGFLATLDAEELTPVVDGILDIATIDIAEGSNGAEYDLFLPFISIEGFDAEANEELGFLATFMNDDRDDTLDLSPFFINTEELPFLSTGFAPGFSYYFSFTNWEAELAPGI